MENTHPVLKKLQDEIVRLEREVESKDWLLKSYSQDVDAMRSRAMKLEEYVRENYESLDYTEIARLMDFSLMKRIHTMIDVRIIVEADVDFDTTVDDLLEDLDIKVDAFSNEIAYSSVESIDTV